MLDTPLQWTCLQSYTPLQHIYYLLLSLFPSCAFPRSTSFSCLLSHSVSSSIIFLLSLSASTLCISLPVPFSPTSTSLPLYCRMALLWPPGPSLLCHCAAATPFDPAPLWDWCYLHLCHLLIYFLDSWNKARPDVWCTSDYRRQEAGMEILHRLDALPQSEGDVHRLLASTSKIHWYTLNPKSWEGEGRFVIFDFLLFDFFLFWLFCWHA